MDPAATGGGGSGLRAKVTILCATAAMLVLGAVYAYGVFLPVFMRDFGLERSAAALPQSVMLFVYAVGMGLGGALQDRTSPTLVAGIGAVVFGAGFCFSSTASSLSTLALTVGLVAGLGFGFIYVSAVTAVLKSFPTRRGLAAGIVVGAFGLGTFGWAPLSQSLLDAGTDWRRIFLSFGFISLIALSALSMGIRAPRRAPGMPETHPSLEGLSFRQALGSRHFWIVFAAYTAVTTAGLMWLAHFKTFGLSVGMSASGAAFLVSLTSIGSGGGRVLMGWASDRIGRFPSLIGASLLEALLLVALGIGLPQAAIGVAAVLAGFAFGTWLALYGPTATDLFGMRSAGSIYGVLYMSYGIGGLAGPLVGGWLADRSGSYRLALFVMAGLCLIGAALFTAALLMRHPLYKHPPALEEEPPL